MEANYYFWGAIFTTCSRPKVQNLESKESNILLRSKENRFEIFTGYEKEEKGEKWNRECPIQFHLQRHVRTHLSDELISDTRCLSSTFFWLATADCQQPYLVLMSQARSDSGFRIDMVPFDSVCYNPAPATAVAGGIMFFWLSSICLSLSHKQNIARIPSGIFNFGSSRNWKDFGHRGQGHCNLMSICFLRSILSNLAQMSICSQEHTDQTSVIKGQGHYFWHHLTQMSSRIKWWGGDILCPKVQLFHCIIMFSKNNFLAIIRCQHRKRTGDCDHMCSIPFIKFSQVIPTSIVWVWTSSCWLVHGGIQQWGATPPIHRNTFIIFAPKRIPLAAWAL